jgi:anti-sigma B factor antagonist
MELRRRDDVAILAPQRDLDGKQDTADFERAAADALARGDRYVVVDLSGVKYANSSGLGALVAAQLKLEEAGARMFLCGVSKRIRNVLEITRLEKIFHMAETEEEAVGLIRE